MRWSLIYKKDPRCNLLLSIVGQKENETMNRIVVCLVVVMLACVSAFNAVAGRSLARAQRSLKMEYIPDGISKAQWEKMKAKEAEALKNKNLGAVGITKFKSRSFEAFQKSGAKNLFPVDKDTPMDQRPYMMRPGGQPDGSDLLKKGIVGRYQTCLLYTSPSPRDS